MNPDTTLAMDILMTVSPFIFAGLWYYFFERIPLYKIDDIDRVLDVLQWESEEVHNHYVARGSMTRHEWRLLKQQHMARIDASLGTVNGQGPALLRV